MQQVAPEGREATAVRVHRPGSGAQAAARRSLIDDQRGAAAVSQIQDATHHLPGEDT